ncbi:hypothetical protein CASFOL_029144 [Castilleja foliolosa]|uniref:Uncharacterized protein n=1 Tax=Castilleja foliolosa TaxID=1961234 RepID=A0ABD3CEM4_9LAMI
MGAEGGVSRVFGWGLRWFRNGRSGGSRGCAAEVNMQRGCRRWFSKEACGGEIVRVAETRRFPAGPGTTLALGHCPTVIVCPVHGGDSCTILVHGFSRVVMEILRTAAHNKKNFRVFCTGTY